MGVKLFLPDFVYHGTSFDIAVKFEQAISVDALIKYSKNKDFGSGLYTTIDIAQSQIWATRCYEFDEEQFEENKFNDEQRDAYFNLNIKNVKEKTPVVVRYKIDKLVDVDQYDIQIFGGECYEWSEFILRHRIHSEYNNCDCLKRFGNHPDIIVGLMADNKISKVMVDFKKLFLNKVTEESVIWFQEAITKTQGGQTLQGLGLGNQLSFHNPDLNAMLTLDGLFIAETWYNKDKGIVSTWSNDFIKWGELR
ncbi:DUF3990 domain-containing protein [Paenibacillus agaridevorans]|uniref:DUF3990 domain-containing protein n=1 Tax=Paenibacillus agaridevorans TaxID=171404 RepID=UPI001BE4C636|nr:DUF3990 domain-containing protein [Paenibacillus agaridevorans]